MRKKKAHYEEEEPEETGQAIGDSTIPDKIGLLLQHVQKGKKNRSPKKKKAKGKNRS